MSSIETITAQIKVAPEPKEGEEVHPAAGRVGAEYSVTKSMPETTTEACEMWGEDVVYSRLMGAVVIDCQSLMRSKIKGREFNENELQAAIDNWTPGSGRAPGVSAEQKAENVLAGMSDEALEAFMDRVNAKKAEKAAA